VALTKELIDVPQSCLPNLEATHPLSRSVESYRADEGKANRNGKAYPAGCPRLMSRAREGVLVFLFVLALVAASAHTASAAQQEAWRHPASAELPVGPAPPSGAAAPANYDEQVGITFQQNFSSLTYNVTAVAQTDSNGNGPAYLLNGLTEGGYWYQIGMSYNWPYLKGGHVSGWSVNFEVFDSIGHSIFPSSGEGGVENFSGHVNDGDPVLLSLSFAGGQVQMEVRDWSTGAEGAKTYVAEGTEFIGLSTSDNYNGYFTGLMTEWYRNAEYVGSEGAVSYTNPSTAITSGVVWADEFNTNTSSRVFGDSRSYSFSNPEELQSFSSHGATAYADAYKFITGSLDKTLLTLSYSVIGGGTAYSPPVLSYTLNGAQATPALTEVPTTYFADAGTRWQLSNTLAGSSATERWETDQQTNGSGVVSLTEGVVYFHQFLFTFGFSVIGGGTGYSPPQVQSFQFGSSLSVTGGTSGWADAGSIYTYDSALAGSSSIERWAAENGSGTIAQSETHDVQYNHQYGLHLGYIVVGGGSPAPPELTGVQFGREFSAPVSNSTTYFLDPGSAWSLPALLSGSNALERWTAATLTNGTVFQPETSAVIYHHQYSVAVNANPSLGGTVSPPSGWEDAGSSVQMSQSASQEWKFEGWNGSGEGSYSGVSGSPSIQVDSPILENATFYPGLRLTAGDNGEVTYGFGSQRGSVSPGSSATVFAPLGTRVQIQANPASLIYSFSGWSQGANGTSVSTAIDLRGPAAATASFSLNSIVIGGIGGGVLVVVGVVAFVLRGRARPPA